MIEFATKMNVNGNKRTLRVYLESKKFEYGHFIVTYNPIIVSTKDIKTLKNKFEIEGFKEV